MGLPDTFQLVVSLDTSMTPPTLTSLVTDYQVNVTL